MTAAFFDLDGTLFDTRADLAATVNHTRRDLGLAELPPADVIACVGQGARYLLEHAIPECSAGATEGQMRRTFEELWAIFRSHYAEHCIETLTPYQGVMDTLVELKRRGWLLGIVTNKPNFAVRLIVEKFGLEELFGDAVVAGGDCAALKPDTLPIMECASRLGGHRLTSCDWMVGDSWTDMRCAESAGVKGAFCAFGFGRLNGAPVTATLRRFDEFLSL